MYNVNLKMIKITIVILTLSVVVNMVSGITILRDSYYWRGSYFLAQWDYFQTKTEYSYSSRTGIFDWLAEKKRSHQIKQANPSQPKISPSLFITVS